MKKTRQNELKVKYDFFMIIFVIVEIVKFKLVVCLFVYFFLDYSIKPVVYNICIL